MGHETLIHRMHSALAIPLKRLQGKYEILERLQEGGMGAIYKVRHRLLGEVRVVKMIRPHLEGDPTLEARFLKEARAAAKLSHPNIARIYDYSVDEDGVAYIVMEFIKGLTLNELLRPVVRTAVGRTEGESLPLALAIEIAQQSLRAIGHVHSHGIVHRDISPDNLMLTRDVEGRPLVKLIDLGLVKAAEGPSQLTAAGVFVGKFRYAAPEQFEDSYDGDRRRSDLYSFGVVLYELLTGRYPIVGNSPSSLIAGHLFRPPLAFSDSDPDGRIPERIRRAVLCSLAKDADERFESAETFAAALAEEEWDLTSPDVESVVESTQKIVRPILPAPRPGSTQSRLDRNFVAEPTPAPATASEMATATAEETVVLPAASILQHRSRSRGDAGELLRQSRELHREGKVEEALAKAEEAREIAPQHARIEVLLFELEREVESRQQKQALKASRRSAEAEIRELVENGNVEAAAERLPEALEVAGPTMVLRNLQAQIDHDLDAGSEAGMHRDQTREQRAVELVAAARRRARAEEFAAAAELLRQALNLVPDHAEALTLRASVEACLQVQAEEIQEAEEVERTLTSIRTLLADGQVVEALSGVGSAVRRFGERQDLRQLHQEVAQVQFETDVEAGMPASDMPAASGDPAPSDPPTEATVVLEKPPAAEIESAVATETLTEGIAEVTASIRQLQSRGEHGRALETLQTAVQTHGTLEVFKDLRYELGQAMLDQDAAREVPVRGDAGSATAGPLRLDDLPLGPEPESSPAPAFDQTRVQPPSSPIRGGGRGGWKLPLALLAVILIGLAIGLLLGQRGKSRSGSESLATEDVVAQALDPGFVTLDAVPWAEILRIVPILDEARESAGEEVDEEVPITPSRYTPVVLQLPPGRYRLTLSYPPAGGIEEIEIDVVSGGVLERRVSFEALDGDKYFDQIGWR